MSHHFNNYIAGEWKPARSGKTIENRNPADSDDLIGVFPDSDEEDLNEAVAAAREAYPVWRKTPAPIRALKIQRVGELMRERKEEISQQMTREMGKVIAETRGDTQEGVDTAFYMAGEGRRLFGITTPVELPNKFGMAVRRPVGVAGLITPWNFPMAIPTWKTFPALVAGNTAVIKPATFTPATVCELGRLLEDAGVPPGVFNIVCGRGSAVGEAILHHSDINVVSFTGSSAIGRRINEVGGKNLKRVSLELGGKNAQIVLDDADLELALEGVLWGAFGTTGQRCTATSRLIIQEKVHDKLVQMLVDAAGKLKLGDGRDESVQVGPLVSEDQRKVVHSYVEIGKEEGAELALGGEAYTEGACAKGFFYRPTVFTGVTPTMRIAREEIFGPVLSVIKVKDAAEAVAVLNDTSYGLSSSIYTRDVNLAFRAIEDIEAGITYVNGPTIGAEVHLPFGGVKDTGNGHREGSFTAFDVFTEWKSVYVDYSGRLQRAQIDVEE
ncbi:MAG: aldehyde dehydrogenase family protein [Candidatus Zixiibacteriota bacterium]|jgi:aldehyde dehydrogenase (NAD+)